MIEPSDSDNPSSDSRRASSGDDQGHKTVTLVKTGVPAVSLEGWQLVDKQRNRFGIGAIMRGGGTAATAEWIAPSGFRVGLSEAEGSTLVEMTLCCF